MNKEEENLLRATTKDDADQEMTALTERFSQLSFAQSEIVTVLVDTDSVRFYIHREIVIEASPFFAKCLDVQANFLESQKKTIRLAEDDAEGFSVLVAWFYKQHVPDFTADDSDKFCHAYILADKYRVPVLKNRIMDIIRENISPVVVLDFINTHDVPFCPMVDYALDEIAQEMMIHPGSYFEIGHLVNGDNAIESVVDNSILCRVIWNLSQNLVARLLWKICQNRAGTLHVPPCTENGCFYHDHTEEGGPKSKCVHGKKSVSTAGGTKQPEKRSREQPNK